MKQTKPFRDVPGLAQVAGAKGGKKSKGRTLSEEHKQKLAESQARAWATRRKNAKR
jgi:hypothetical protein